MSGLASVQETALDIVWIRDGVTCLGTGRAERWYRAVLAVEGPPEAFAPEAERTAAPLNAFGGFLTALDHALQVLVLPRPANLDQYAGTLESRAENLPPTLAAEARADARWAHQEGPGLGLLDRRAYVVVPAEDLAPAQVLGRVRIASGRLVRSGRGGGPDEAAARRRLDERCAALTERLWRGGVWSERLDEAALASLLHTCWSAWRHNLGDSRSSRFARDLGEYVGAAARRT
jgi:hypothetical protein